MKKMKKVFKALGPEVVEKKFIDEKSDCPKYWCESPAEAKDAWTESNKSPEKVPEKSPEKTPTPRKAKAKPKPAAKPKAKKQAAAKKK